MSQNLSATGMTQIAFHGQTKVIRKMAATPVEVARLEYQYVWLKERENLPHLPKVAGFYATRDRAALELEYFPDSISFYDFIHQQNDLARPRAVLESILKFLDTRIHVRPSWHRSRIELEQYFTEKVLSKLKECERILPSFSKLASAERLRINGQNYENAQGILGKIQNDASLMEKLSNVEQVALHGDPTVDNIVVARNGSDFLVLDPNGENYLSDRLVDYAKLTQSLGSGYEFLCRMTEIAVTKGSVEFDPALSAQYRTLADALRHSLSRRLDEERRPLLKFHEAVHFARMLPYKARSRPEIFGAFYGTMVALFNEFYRETRA